MDFISQERQQKGNIEIHHCWLNVIHCIVICSVRFAIYSCIYDFFVRTSVAIWSLACCKRCTVVDNSLACISIEICFFSFSSVEDPSTLFINAYELLNGYQSVIYPRLKFALKI